MTASEERKHSQQWGEYEGDECVSANLRPSAQESAQEVEREKGELLGMEHPNYYRTVYGAVFIFQRKYSTP